MNAVLHGINSAVQAVQPARPLSRIIEKPITETVQKQIEQMFRYPDGQLHRGDIVTASISRAVIVLMLAGDNLNSCATLTCEAGSIRDKASRIRA
jgi:hypothetical protein